MKTLSTKRSVIWPVSQGMTMGLIKYFSTHKYSVKDADVDIFVKFINTFEQKLKFDQDEKESKALNISIERYVSSLLESEPIDRKLMTAVMGLESLYTLDKERGENAFKLGIRVAKLLGNMGFDSTKVRELTERAYFFRNTVVHGAYISQKMQEQMNEIFPTILNYLRVSLIIFLLSPELGKHKMINMIDQATINEIQNEKLKEILKKHMDEFKPLLT